jgi:hypothetical protein
VVDDCARTADPHIVAAGDCTARQLADGSLLRLESVQNATEQGKSAAAALLGQPRPFTATPWFWSDQYDKKLQMAGLSTGADAWTVRGDMAAGASFSIYHFRAGKLVGVDSVNAAKDHLQARKLLDAGVSPTVAQVEDSGFDLAGLLDARLGPHPLYRHEQPADAFMSRAQGIGEQARVLHVLVNHLVAKAAQPHPDIGGLDPAESLGLPEVVDGRPARLPQPIQQGRQELVAKGVLQPAKPGHERIDALRQDRVGCARRHPRHVHGFGKQAGVGVGQQDGLALHHREQEAQALVECGPAHKRTPDIRATWWMGKTRKLGALSTTSTRRPPRARSRRAPSVATSTAGRSTGSSTDTSRSMSPPRRASSRREPNSCTCADAPATSATSWTMS